MDLSRLWIVIGGISGLLGVAAGAFGAHALKSRLPPDLLQVFETGARYHQLHALLLVCIGIFASVRPSPLLTWAGASALGGTLLFSGSLYILALSGERWLGAITPLGGLLFMAAWLLLALSAFKT
jgi:uncharacterized membrane protein YgdD (TMEM256/DUF423 family)